MHVAASQFRKIYLSLAFCVLLPFSALNIQYGFAFAFNEGPPSQTAATVQETIPASDQAEFQQAIAELNENDPSQAKTLLQNLHRKYPRNFEINESLGLLCASSSSYVQAEKLLAAAAQEQPDSDVAHANLGVDYLKLHRPGLAVGELRTATRLNPSNSSTQIALGQALMLVHQPHRAAAAFNAALTQQPANSDLLYNAALAEFEDGQPAKSQALLARMGDADASASAQSLYGDVEEKLGNYKQATQHYANAVTLDPSESNVYLLGIEFLRHWTFGPAIQEFRAATQKFPGSRRMRMGLAIAYYGNGNYDQAIPILADLLAQDPNSSLYADLLGRTCTVLTEGINPQCSTLVGFAENHPRNAILATYAATSILHSPSSPESLALAHKLLRQALAADPKLPEAQFDMGTLLQTQSQWQQSIPWLERAIRLKPDYAEAHYRLARAYSHVGRHNEARKQIALDQRYSKEHQNQLDTRMKEITTLVVKLQ